MCGVLHAEGGCREIVKQRSVDPARTKIEMSEGGKGRWRDKREVNEMSKWTHSICAKCWNERNPDSQAVVIREEYRDEQSEPCCVCGTLHQSGIYQRADPTTLQCKGEGIVHAEKYDHPLTTKHGLTPEGQ
jgi:hypothetical protein